MKSRAVSYACLLFFLLSCQGQVRKNQFNKHPGYKELNKELLKKITIMKTKRGKSYKPRTKHLLENKNAKFTNRLFLESSPYLLQHAHNPVNWYPWSKEAFERARKENKPVFLSVGYSTCHWCHVMEEESFEDLEIAKYLNENYICIKVDREERPDVDSIYMNSLHALGISGGWPMSVWLTDEKKPFYGGTYFPARDGDRGAPRGFLSILKILKKGYDEQKDKVKITSEQLVSAIKKKLTPIKSEGLPSINILRKAALYYKEIFDKVNGGVGQGNKFPSSLPISFLLRYYKRTKDQEVLDMINLTLIKMSRGGIYDQAGGGFHRYATDPQWLVPHFEKMLYDNALLSVNFLEAYQLTKSPEFLRITNEILNYIQRDMTSKDGAFYSATDADSLGPNGEREEGYFFTWKIDELRNLLWEEEYKLAVKAYRFSYKGNFEGRNILHKSLMFDEREDLKLKSIKKKLYLKRKERAAPIRDEKILVAWNALMISGYAKAGRVLKNKNYIKIAKKAADFILKNMYQNKRLLRSYKDDIAKNKAYLSDYVFFIQALLDLFESCHELKWLKIAIELDQTLKEYFEDNKDGGFFMTAHDHEKLLSKQKPSYDGAEPTGNSIHAQNLIRLSELTSSHSYLKRAEKIFEAFSKTLNTNPTSLSSMLPALESYFSKGKEIVIITPKGKKEAAQKFVDIIDSSFIPHHVLVVGQKDASLESLSMIVPLVKMKVPLKNGVTAYVCKKGICELPTKDINIFKKQILK